MGDGKRDILSAPAPQSGCAGGWYRLKRKSVLGNSIRGTGTGREASADGEGYIAIWTFEGLAKEAGCQA